MSEKSRFDTNGYVWSRSVPDPGQLVEVRRRQWVNEDLLTLSQSTGRRVTVEEVRGIYTRYEEMLNSDVTEQRALVLDLIERVEVFPEGFLNIAPK